MVSFRAFMSDDRKSTGFVSVEESAALLRAIFPAYPEVRDMKPPPNLKEFLREYRGTQRTQNGEACEVEQLDRFATIA